MLGNHLQCTEEKPICSRCTRLKLDCEYGLRLLWKEDAEQRNISLGREGMKPRLDNLLVANILKELGPSQQSRERLKLVLEDALNLLI